MEKIFINIVNSFKTNGMKTLSGKSNIYSPDIFLSPDSNNIDFNKFKSYVYARTKAYVRFLESYHRLDKFNKYNKGNFEKVLASNSNIYFSSLYNVILVSYQDFKDGERKSNVFLMS